MKQLDQTIRSLMANLILLGDDIHVLALTELLEERNRLKAALTEISQGKGRYSLDQLEHASNTIEDMKEIADKALL